MVESLRFNFWEVESFKFHRGFFLHEGVMQYIIVNI